MKRIVPVFILLFFLSSAKAQTDTAFWFAAPDISSAFNYDRPIHFRISSLQQPCTVTISQPAGGGLPTQTFSMPANTTQSIDLAAWLTSIECAPGNVVQNKGLKIVSNNKITVYYEVNANGPNPELFSLKGRNALGRQFYISSQYLLNNTSIYSPTPISSFNIVATEDNTQVTITPTKDIVGHGANVPFTVTLNSGQTYAAIATSVLAAQHLQGSVVSSTKPVAITLSDDLLKGTAYGGACEDLAGDQTVPVSVTGMEYIAFQSSLNAPSDKVYITATQNGTIVTQDGVGVGTLNAGQSTQLTVSNPTTYIQLSAPGYAYEMSGYACEVGSAILPKINCTGSSSVSIVRSTNENFTVTLLVRNGAQGNFLVNGVAGIITAGQFNAVPATGGLWYGAKVTLPLASYPNGGIIKINNTSSIFQMGVLQGQVLGVGFGYFSDFNSLEANAVSTTLTLCEGNTIRLFADTIVSATYSWIGPGGYTSNIQNPVINSAAVINSGNYILTATVPGCGSYLDTINITVNPKVSNTISQSICQGQSYFGYTTSGIYKDTLQTTKGCDSVRTVILTVKPKSFSTINQAICQGQSYLGHAAGGTYIDTLLATNGCDSVRTLNLTVKPRSLTTINQSICQGGSFLGYNIGGTYNDTLLAANGCDSIRTLILVVKPKSITTVNMAVCKGQTFLGYSNTGSYIDTFIASNGCDSVRTLNLVVNQPSTSVITQSICQGTSYLGYSTTGTFNDTLIAVNGCDSVRTLHLVVKQRAFSSISNTICQGITYLGHSTTGIFSDTLVATNGCDSIRTLSLTVNPRPLTTISQTICEGQSFEGYSTTGKYKDTFSTAAGCDSIRTLNLAVNSKPKPDLGADAFLCKIDTLSITPGQFLTYLWQDGSTADRFTVKQAGIYSVTVSNTCGTATDDLLITEKSCSAYFPNAFTPNKDGKNEVFKVLNLKDLQEYYLAIYNRWGQKIFETSDYTSGWDGTVNGKAAEIGAYVWYCDFKKLDIRNHFKGTVVLVR
ncbi:MAG: gliding motility-associated C-terminal domain-containing protein [Chitinophagaceae bacterium]